jgi:hypothetical protein
MDFRTSGRLPKQFLMAPSGASLRGYMRDDGLRSSASYQRAFRMTNGSS